MYDWYRRGLDMLEAGSPEAAATLLWHAHRAEPGSASIREALARALFDAHRYDEAEDLFGTATATDPTDDYAHFGLGLARYRRGEVEAALEPLALAAAMRPEQRHYAEALRQARATLRARRTQ